MYSRPSRLKKEEPNEDPSIYLKQIDDMISAMCYMCEYLYIETIQDNYLDEYDEWESWDLNIV